MIHGMAHGCEAKGFLRTTWRNCSQWHAGRQGWLPKGRRFQWVLFEFPPQLPSLGKEDFHFNLTGRRTAQRRFLPPVFSTYPARAVITSDTSHPQSSRTRPRPSGKLRGGGYGFHWSLATGNAEPARKSRGGSGAGLPRFLTGQLAGASKQARRIDIEKQRRLGLAAEEGRWTGRVDRPRQGRFHRLGFAFLRRNAKHPFCRAKQRNSEREGVLRDRFEVRKMSLVDLLLAAGHVQFDELDLVRVVEIRDLRIVEGEVSILADAQAAKIDRLCRQQGGVAFA